MTCDKLKLATWQRGLYQLVYYSIYKLTFDIFDVRMTSNNRRTSGANLTIILQAAFVQVDLR
jgi:hypothetical protein